MPTPPGADRREPDAPPGTINNPIIVDGNDEAAQARAAELTRATGVYHGVMTQFGPSTCGDPQPSTAYEPEDDGTGRQVIALSNEKIAPIRPSMRAARELGARVRADRATAASRRRGAKVVRRPPMRSARRRECRPRARRSTTSRDDGSAGGEPPAPHDRGAA